MNAISSATSGMNYAMNMSNRSADVIAKVSTQQESNTNKDKDMNKALVEQRQAVTLFTANAKGIKTYSNMIGSLLDTKV